MQPRWSQTITKYSFYKFSDELSPHNYAAAATLTIYAALL